MAFSRSIYKTGLRLFVFNLVITSQHFCVNSPAATINPDPVTFTHIVKSVTQQRVPVKYNWKEDSGLWLHKYSAELTQDQDFINMTLASESLSKWSFLESLKRTECFRLPSAAVKKFLMQDPDLKKDPKIYPLISDFMSHLSQPELLSAESINLLAPKVSNFMQEHATDRFCH